MTTDELLEKLPSHIGNHHIGGGYIVEDPDDSVEWLYLHNDGKDWLASYGIRGEFVCLNPKEGPPYNNAFAYGTTPNEALQRLYDWCVKNNFIKD